MVCHLKNSFCSAGLKAGRTRLATILICSAVWFSSSGKTFCEQLRSAEAYENAVQKLALGWAIDEAIVKANEAVKLFPKSPASYRARAYCYAETKKFKQAMSDINKAIELNPKDAASYMVRSTIYQYQDENEKALADLARAIKLNPQELHYRVNRAYLLNGLGRFDEAIKDFDYAIDKRPIKKFYFRGRAAAFEGKREFQKAANDYSRAIALGNKPEDRIKRASTYMRLKKYEKAIEDFDLIIKGDPKDDEAILRRAEAYYRLKKYKEALKDLNSVIALDSTSGIAYFLRAWVYKALGDEEKFNRDIRLAAKNNWTIVNNLNKRLRYEIPESAHLKSE